MEAKDMKLLMIFGTLFTLLWPGGVLAEQNIKPLYSAKIVFDSSGKAEVTTQSTRKQSNEVDTDSIQLSLMFYAYAMNRAPESKRNDLLNQAQRIVSAVATEDGLVRADILKNNPLVTGVAKENAGKGFEAVFGAIGGKGNTMNVKPIGDSESVLIPSVFYLFQDTITHLSAGGLRLLALALGGTNKWYREKGQASDPQSISQAPAYGLNLAVDIISKLSGVKI